MGIAPPTCVIITVPYWTNLGKFLKIIFEKGVIKVPVACAFLTACSPLLLVRAKFILSEFGRKLIIFISGSDGKICGFKHGLPAKAADGRESNKVSWYGLVGAISPISNKHLLRPWIAASAKINL